MKIDRLMKLIEISTGNMYGSVVERVHVFRLFSCVNVGFKDGITV